MSIKTDSNGDQYVNVDLTTEIQKKLQAADSIKDRRGIAYNYVMDNLRGKYSAIDGREVLVTRRSADELVNDAHDLRLRVIPELESIIKVGKHPIVKDVVHRRFAKFAYYDVRLKVGDDFYTANMNVGIRENGESVLYQINRFKEETATPILGVVRTLAPDKGTALNNKITNSAEKVNSKNKNFSPASGESAHDDFIDLSDVDAFDNPDAAPAANDTGLHPVEQPELVKIVKALLGKAPRVRRRTKHGAYGFAVRDIGTLIPIGPGSF